jgi:pimeloyl-ACP methyl ester carboxylesterase
MIEGRTILCFASGYDAPPTSKHHVMHLLAERNAVLWVNYHASRAPTASSSDLAYIARKLRQVFGGIKKPRQNLYVLTPLVVPLPSRPWARWLNRRLLIPVYSLYGARTRPTSGSLHGIDLVLVDLQDIGARFYTFLYTMGEVMKACGEAGIPVWVFHGGNDGVVKTKRSRNIVEALKKAGSDPKYTEYPGVGHDSWVKAAAEPGLLPWLFAQTKK